MSISSGTRRFSCAALGAALLFGFGSCSMDILNDIKKEIEGSKETEKPKITSFNRTSPAVTNNTVVQFSLAGSVNIKYWLVNESSTAPDKGDSGWVTTAPSGYTLSATPQGPRNVFAWAKTSGGLVSDPFTPITVTLDTVDPTIDTFTRTSATPTYDLVVQISLAGSDATSGISAWFLKEISSTPLLTDTGWTASGTPPTTYAITSSGYGDKTIYAWARDAAGNISDPQSVSVTLYDSGIPTITSFTTAVTVTNNPVIPITNLAGSANITKWLVNESSTAPSVSDSGWVSSAPSTYTLSTTPQGARSIYAWAKTQYEVVSAQYTPITVTLDTIKPAVSSFALSSAYHTDNRNITISLVGSDGTGSGITGWFLKENSTPPGLGDSGWTGSGTPPTTFQVSSAIGIKTVYAWVRDVAGNISSPPPSIEVDLRATPTATLSAGGTIRVGHEPIIVTFNDAMTLGGLTIGGDIGNAATKSLSGDGLTLTLNPSPVWPKGSGKTLTITGTSALGIAMAPFSVSFTIEHAVYVRSNATDDTRAGTKLEPVKTVRGGINKAAVYLPGNTVEVRVAGGGTSYQVNWRTDTSHRVILVEGVSLYGGYSTDFSTRDATLNTTTLEDTSSGSDGSSTTDPDRAVDCPSGITVSTKIDGFTLLLGKGMANAGIYCVGSPSIQHCIIQGRSSADGPANSTYSGILAKDSSATVSDSSIDAGYSPATGNSSGIYGDNSPMVIERNTIKGGNGNFTKGIRLTGSGYTPVIRNNVLVGGTSGNSSMGIYTETAAIIRNNTIDGGSGSTTAHCIHLAGSNGIVSNNIICYASSNSIGVGVYEDSADPDEVKNNCFFNISTAGSGVLYVDESGGSVKDLVTSITLSGETNNLGSWNNIVESLQDHPSFFNIDSSYALTSGTPTTVTGGGLDGWSLGWGFRDDRTGSVTRTGDGTTGWSMGAYEYD
jgi:hypothetical protein